MKLTTFSTSVNVSEAIYETWGFTTYKIVWKRPIIIDADDAAVETTNKGMFIYFNCAPPGNKMVRKLFKAAIIEMYEPNFPNFATSTSLLIPEYLPLNIDRTADSEY